MEGLIQDIYEIYAEEVEVLTGFIRVSTEKKETIKKNDHLQLDRIIRTEEALLMKFTFLQSRRRKAMDMLKNERGIKGEITMRIMNQLLTEEEKDQFALVRKQYEIAIQQQQSINEINAKMLKRQNNYIQKLRQNVDVKQTTNDSEVVVKRPTFDRRG